ACAAEFLPAHQSPDGADENRTEQQDTGDDGRNDIWTFCPSRNQNRAEPAVPKPPAEQAQQVKFRLTVEIGDKFERFSVNRQVHEEKIEHKGRKQNPGGEEKTQRIRSQTVFAAAGRVNQR